MYKNFLLIIAVLGVILTLLGVFLKITHYSFGFLTGNTSLAIAILITMVVWVLVLIDIFLHSTKHNLLWIICMLIFVNITPIIYLIINRKTT